jgi:transcriptional regulator with XRE-family HTH domain
VKLLGLSQKEVARRLGIDPGTLSKWEKGNSLPSKELLKNFMTWYLKQIRL